MATNNTPANVSAKLSLSVKSLVSEELRRQGKSGRQLRKIVATDEFQADLTEIVVGMIHRLADDLEAFAAHAGRRIVKPQDVLLCARKSTSLKTTLESYIESHAKPAASAKRKRVVVVSKEDDDDEEGEEQHRRREENGDDDDDDEVVGGNNGKKRKLSSATKKAPEVDFLERENDDDDEEEDDDDEEDESENRLNRQRRRTTPPSSEMKKKTPTKNKKIVAESPVVLDDSDFDSD